MKKRKQFLPKDIDVNRLVGEIAILIAVVIVGIFAWNIITTPKAEDSDDPYAKYKTIYNDVVAYDYDKGRDKALEARIERAMENASDPSQYFHYAQAKVEYFFRLKNYDAVLRHIGDAEKTAYDPETYVYVYALYIDCYNALGQADRAAEYSEKLKETYGVEYPQQQ